MSKQKISPTLLTAQEFVNVEDIADGILYTGDGYLFAYLSIRAGDNKLMNEEERCSAASSLAASLAGEREAWQLLSVPRTVDTFGMIEHLTSLRRSVQADARLKLLNGEIAALQEMAREGTKEPMIVLKCWIKAARGADLVLKKRIHELRERLMENRVSAELMTDPEIVYLCKVFADLTAYHEQEEPDRNEDVPILIGQVRRFTKKAGHESEGDALRNLMTPIGGLTFGVSKITVGDVLGRVYGATRFPSELDYGWAIELMNASDCVTAITYTPGNAGELGDALSRSIKRSSSDADAERDARRRKRLERQAQDADELIEQMDYRSAAIGHMTLLAMPFTGDEERFEDVCRDVVNRYARKRIKLKSLGALQKEAYRMLSPYHISEPKITNIAGHIMPLESLVGGSPMTVNLYRDAKGYYFGRTMDGSIVSLDLQFRGKDRTNGNMVATGESGQGKSTALKHIVETLYMSGVKVIIIDPEREFRDLTRNLGGSWLDAGGGNAKINPLQIRPVPEDEDETEANRLYQSNDNAMALHIHTLEVFFKSYLPSMDDLQLSLLKKALVETYAHYGITWDTDIAAILPEKFPIMSDLYNTLQALQKEDKRYEVIAALLCDMATGADSFLWNGHTNIAVDSDFVCFDTNRIQNSSEEVKRTQYFNLLTLCWQLMSADRTKPVFLLCDESHLLLDPAIPQTAMFLRNMSKRGRKYEAMLGVVMQSVADALHENIRLYGQALMDNASYKLFFGTDGKNLKETADLFHLTEAEQQILLSKQRGRALCFLGNQHLYVDFDIPKYKLDLMGSGGGR